MPNPERQDRKQAMVLGSFLADAFVLGAHWIYDLEQIKEKFGKYTAPQEPLPNSWHKDKHLGDYTHYGDQAMMLHQYLLAHQGIYSTEGFRTAWQQAMQDYHGYMDMASRQSLEAFARHEAYGSASDELGGAARVAPVLYWIDEPGDALAAAIDQSQLTHNSADSLQATELFTRIIQLLLIDNSASLFGCMTTAARDMLKAGKNVEFFEHYMAKSTPLVGRSAAEIAAGAGQNCHARHAVPVIFTILLTTHDYREAMQLNARIGGDSAARGMVLGAILGAKNGLSCLPAEWLATVHQLPSLS